MTKIQDRYIPQSIFSPEAVPAPPWEHPRLFVRKQHLQTIRQNAVHPRLKPIWDHYVQAAEHQGVVSDLMETTKSRFLGCALLYLFEGRKDRGRQAVTASLKALSLASFEMNKQDISREIGGLMLMGAIVYDWCYDLLETNERDSFIVHFERLAGMLETGYPPVPSSTVTGHAGEAMLIRDMLGAGIAIYDEKPVMYNYVCGIFFLDMVPARNFFYRSHTHHQGDSYGTTRYKWETFPLLMFDRMGFGNVYSEDHGQVPYYWIYIRRPDGLFLRGGDSYTSGDPAVRALTKDTFFSYTASYYKNAHFQYQHDWMYGSEASVDPILDLLLVDPHVGMNPPDELPLTRYFGYPTNTMIARTGWRMGIDSPDVVAEMKVGSYYFANHQHLDAGTFQLYYKGDLAADTGFYRGTGYNSDHVRNYHRRTIAHNCMLVFDPEERFPGNHSNDGGQRMPADRREMRRIADLFEDNQTAEALAHYIGPDREKPELSYLKGDLSSAYSSGKVREYFRSFAFFNLDDSERPAVMIVLDRIVSTNPQFRKSWLLHSMEKPYVSGGVVDIRRTENGYNGRLVNHTLLPAEGDVRVDTIGGEDMQFWVNGRNYPLKEDHKEAGSWRVEVSPIRPAAENVFLNVIQLMDHEDGPEPVVPELIDSECAVGCKLLGKAAIFSKTGHPYTKPFSFSMQTRNEPYRIWLFDLAPGTWQAQVRTGADEAEECGKGEPGLTIIRLVAEDGVFAFDCADRCASGSVTYCLMPVNVE
jgi:hypothetical protein